MSDTPFFTSATGAKTTSADSPNHELKGRSLSVQATWDITTPATAVSPSGTAKVQTLTFPSKADTDDGDFISIPDANGLTWGIGLSKSVYERQTFTFLTKAASTAGNFMVFQDPSGTKWAISINKTGSDPAPTSKAWTDIAAAKKAHVDISSATTAAQVAALMETAMDTLTGFTSVLTTDDTAADGTMLVDSVSPGPVAARQA